MESTTVATTHRLRNYYRFWRSNGNADGTENYVESLEDLGLCRTVEDFWQIYLSLPKIGTENAAYYFLFKNNIEPTWEHERNCQGGRVVVTISRKDLAPYMWELLLLTTIGEQFDVGNEICGVSVNMKRNNCIFMVWNKTATFEQAINKIEMKLKTIWKAPYTLRFPYKLNRSAVDQVAKPIPQLVQKEETNE
mgnify:CR=1 FL=1